MNRPLACALSLSLSCLGLVAQDVPEPAAAPAAPLAEAAPAPAAPAETPKAKPAQPLLDGGLLDPSWFGTGVVFASASDIDAYWIKPGLDLSGHTLCMKVWDDPVMLDPKRDGKDNAKATALTDSLPATIRGALAGSLKGKVKVSRTEGDIEVTGRIVDCNAGNTAAKFLVGFGAGQERATFDIKFVDAASKELLIAIHHRTISGTLYSTIESKLVKWSDKFGQFLAKSAVL